MSAQKPDLSKLSPAEKRALLKKLAEQKLQKESFFPLSYGQRALWQIQNLMPETPVYNVSLVWLILSELDIPALKKTFQWLIDRHPCIRTTYTKKDKELLQKIHPHQKVYFKIHQISDMRKEEFQRELDREAYRSFNLEKGPMLRVNLYIRTEGHHILMVSFHHIAVDLWSSTYIYNEVATLYPAAKSGKTPLPPPSDKQYSDYVSWQRDMLSGPKGEKLWDYWRKQFEGDVLPLNLPIQLEQSVHQKFIGAAYPFKINKILTRRLRALTKERRITLYTLLTTGFQCLLFRYTGQECFFIRSLTAGRSRADFEKIIGFFANPVVLKSDFSNNPSFFDMLDRMQKIIVQTIDNQDFPFELLMEKLGYGKDIQFNPNPEIMFILQTPQRFVSVRQERHKIASRGIFAPGRTGIQINLGGLILEKFNPEMRVTLNDLSIEMAEVADELSGVIHYRTDLFLPRSIAKMADHFEELLEFLVFKPNSPVSTFVPKDGLPKPEKPPLEILKQQRQETAQTLLPEYIPPRTSKEKKLVQIWEEVLGLSKIGIYDDFFERGGSSLQALQLITLIRDAFQVELPLRQLLEVRNVAGLLDIINRSDILSDLPPIEPKWRDEDLPLSFVQKRLWFQNRLTKGHHLYNIPIPVRLKGPIDLDILEKCVNTIIQRHEVLRTVFPEAEGQPKLFIHSHLDIKIRLEDLSHLEKIKRLKKARRLAEEEAQKPFDITKGPLIRIVLFKLDKEDHAAVLTKHHIISDGWSFGIFLRELAKLYEAFKKEKPSPLPELLIQYADFAFWQTQLLEEKAWKSQVKYWKQKLKNLPAMDLPFDRPRPQLKSYKGSKYSFILSKTILKSLEKLSEQQGVTLFMTLLTAFLILLHRYTQQDDIVIGSPIAGRIRPEIEELIGCFINIVVLRFSLNSDHSFLELLLQVREVALETYANQDLPFEKLVKILQPERDLSRDPLFQVMFAFQNLILPSMKIPEGPRIEKFELDRGISQYDLTLFMSKEASLLSGVVEYSLDLFDKNTIHRLIENFKTLIKGIISNPHQKISDLPLLTKAEKHKILVKWNDTKKDYPLDTPVHKLFEKQAEQTPDKIAVVHENKKFTYQDLNIEANRLAHQLKSQGAQPGEIVGICMNRSFDLIKGIYAILKTGAAYVPLDPNYPSLSLRFHHILKDTSMRMILSHSDQSERFIDLKNISPKIVLVDEDQSTISQKKPKNPIIPVKPDDTAYVIYTSGSTGFPKGTKISHRSLLNYLFWCRENYNPDKGNGILLHSSILFDFSITSLFLPLISGLPLILAPENLEEQTMVGMGSTNTNWSLLKLTPLHAQVIGDQISEKNNQGRIQMLILGGEELKYEHLKSWRKYDPNMTIFNEYGPTEATVGCCVYRLPTKSTESGSIPIGRPIANTCLYILDKHQNPVPVGVPGEIYISGICLAQEYLNLPELNKDKFIPDPFKQDPSGRLFKTGDLAKFLPSGDIQFLGRTDDQVKIRGFRIELKEIETKLLQHPTVKRAAVIVHETRNQDKSLVAYITGDLKSELSPSKIQAFLKTKLPQYMIPSDIIFIEEFPLTPGGKLDHKALKLLKRSRAGIDREYDPPRTNIQKKLVIIWSDILGIKKVGIYDNFFELGGHSLQILQIANKINKVLRVEISLLDLMKEPTVKAQASILENMCKQKKKTKHSSQ